MLKFPLDSPLTDEHPVSMRDGHALTALGEAIQAAPNGIPHTRHYLEAAMSLCAEREADLTPRERVLRELIRMALADLGDRSRQ